MEKPTEPPWLDDEEQLAWLALFYLTTRLPSALDAQSHRDAGISLYEYQVLAALSMGPDRTLSMTDLADFTASSLSRLSNVASRLERQGWLRRNLDPAGGRRTLATLTEAGYDKVAAAAPFHVQEVRRLILDPLTRAQRGHMLQACRRILHAIDPDDTRADNPFLKLGRADSAGSGHRIDRA